MVALLGLSLAALLVLDLSMVLNLRALTLPWDRVEPPKVHLPKDLRYANVTAQQLASTLPIWVVSLARAKERRSNIVACLAAAGVPPSSFELVDAVDGQNTSQVTPEDVSRFLGSGRLARRWRAGHKYVRDKFAVDLSHFHLLERVASSGSPAIVLEDDAVLRTSNLYASLAVSLPELPSDWQLLYLGACTPRLGVAVGPHMTVLRGGCCTFGYVATPAFAVAALRAAERTPLKGWHVDEQYDKLVKRRVVQAYMITPPLAFPSGTPSLLAYASKHKEEFYNDSAAATRRAH